jgi:L-lysine 6-transaminase
MNIAKNSKFNIKIDFDKSHDSFLYDKNTEREYLDFFGMYASLPLGYNHKIFQTEEFKNEILSTSTFKVNNCEFVSDETLEFDRLFSEYAGSGNYKHFHYCCTGALAVEAAIKACLQYKNFHSPKIISFNNSFHGVNSYGGFVTSRFWPANLKLDGFPEILSCKLAASLKRVEEELMKSPTTCILVEPIQCSAGDIHLRKEFLVGLRALADSYDVPLVFDEIQIGFGATGKLWYYEHLDIEPDILIFGKKTQLSGIMAKDKHSQIFQKENITRLEVTWNSDVVDMVRCKHIIKAYKKYNILENVENVSQVLISSLEKNKKIKNLRNAGLIIGFDLEDTQSRNKFVKDLYNVGLLCNSTGRRSIRLRPNLNLTPEEAELAIEKINKISK